MSIPVWIWCTTATKNNWNTTSLLLLVSDPHVITLNFAGPEKLSLDAQGGLELAVQKSQVRLEKPRIYQEVDGARIEISGNYVLKSAHEAGFQIAAYDRSRPLIIDPVLAYSTYLGGSGGNN